MATKLRKGQIYEIVKTGYRLKIVKIGKFSVLEKKYWYDVKPMAIIIPR